MKSLQDQETMTNKMIVGLVIQPAEYLSLSDLITSIEDSTFHRGVDPLFHDIGNCLHHHLTAEWSPPLGW